ncbi:MAG TPA: FG-GAP-like repeat-containing protein [Acidimicrobiales bacterium]|nr:FG-GAP-like repeat-containing protein [Acidimicrobiales bacterium]
MLALVTVVAVLTPLLGVADTTDAATTRLRLVRTIERTLSTFEAGAGTTESFSTAAVGDVTGDGRPDLVHGGMDGRLQVHHADGRLALDLDHDGAIQASPALVDLNGDGVLDIVIATANRSGGRVLAYTGRGTRLFSALDAPRSPSYPRGFFGTPAVGDLTGDGRPEIVAAGFDHNIHAWTLDGRALPGFPRFVYDTVWSSPVLADLDGDGRDEIVVGGDMDAYPGAPYPAGGLVWALRANGSDVPGFPRSLPGQTIWSSPAVVDLTGDGRPEIVVGTGLHFPGVGAVVHALDGRTGAHVRGWPAAVPGRVMASPAVADLTGDGRPEVVVATEGGWVVALTASGGTLWRTCNRSSRTSCDGSAGTHGQVAVADVDGDGVAEVVAATEQWIRVLDGRDRSLEAEYAMAGVWPPGASPTIAEVDGRTWIVLNTLVNAGPAGRGAGDRQVLWVWTTDTALGRAEWPTFQRDMARSGTTHSAGQRSLPEGCVAWGAGPIQRLYRAYFLRDADTSGLTYWMGRRSAGVTLGAVSSAFAASAEFRARYGTVDDAGFVRLVYGNVLDRAPDASGLAYWTTQMAAGRLGRAGLMLNFSESREYRAATGDCP